MPWMSQKASLPVHEQELLRSRGYILVSVPVNPLQRVDAHRHASEPRRGGARHRPELELEWRIDRLTSARAHKVHAGPTTAERSREEPDGVLAVRNVTNENVGCVGFGFDLINNVDGGRVR